MKGSGGDMRHTELTESGIQYALYSNLPKEGLLANLAERFMKSGVFRILIKTEAYDSSGNTVPNYVAVYVHADHFSELYQLMTFFIVAITQAKRKGIPERFFNE